MICIWSSWCHCHPIISCASKIQNGFLSGAALPRLSSNKRLLNSSNSKHTSTQLCSCNVHCSLCERLWVINVCPASLHRPTHALTVCWQSSQLPTSTHALTVCLLIPRSYDTTVCQQLAVLCKQTSNQLSNLFSNRFDNQLNVCLHDTAGCQTRLSNQVVQPVWQLYNRFDNHVEQTATVRSTGCQTRFDNTAERTAVRSTGCQTGLYKHLTTGCIHDTAGCQTGVECLYTRYNRLSNRFDNRLYRVNRASG